ncbi:MAG TPA: cytidylate kinase-like family protein [Candidatus Dormibacteraeota bacterium]|nr:cytidylate kinase-like family protein [Candidatus Dormibacteraeota bacterium]
MPALTISGPYGSGVSVLAREVASRLGWPLFDTVIPATVADALDVPTAVAEGYDGRSSGFWERLLSTWAVDWSAALPVCPTLFAGADLLISEETFHRQTERIIRRCARGRGAIVAGRGAAFLLGRRPDLLHVRLTSPPRARVVWTARRDRLSTVQVEHLRRAWDERETMHVRRRYGADVEDRGAYDLVLDPLAAGRATTVAAIVHETEVRFRRLTPR